MLSEQMRAEQNNTCINSTHLLHDTWVNNQH